MSSNIKILGYTWFTEMGSFNPIGIVHIHNGFDEKAYIGTGNGSDMEEDIQSIIKKGAKFPIAALPTLGLTHYVSPESNTDNTPTI